VIGDGVEHLDIADKSLDRLPLARFNLLSPWSRC
jgi:hypothetical protein